MLRARIVRAVFGIGLSMLAGIAVFVLWHRDTRGVSIDGVRRSYDVVVEGGAGSDPVPLVFIFHGRNGSAGAIRRRTGIDAAARELGDRALFVYPQGRPYPGGHVVGWQTACDGPDMRFLDVIVQTLAAEYSIDRTRILASGFSWGGEMAIAFGCCRHDSVRAIAPLSGGVWDNVGDACRGHAPALRIAIGDADPIVPLRVVQHLTDDFRAIQGCATRSHEIDPHCRAYDGCREAVIQCVYRGLAHELPSNGGREVWSFLRSFPGALQ
jgi:polyhydroxybutyrate depolymerase